MRSLTFQQVAEVNGAEINASGVCAAILAGYGGAIALGIAAGLTDGVALLAGIEIAAWGAQMGMQIGDVVC